jgi:hypothetical protein
VSNYGRTLLGVSLEVNVNRLRKAAPEIDRIIESSELTESPKNPKRFKKALNKFRIAL